METGWSDCGWCAGLTAPPFFVERLELGEGRVALVQVKWSLMALPTETHYGFETFSLQDASGLQMSLDASTLFEIESLLEVPRCGWDSRL